MNRALPIIALALGLGLGFLLGQNSSAPDEAGLSKSRDSAGEDLVKRSEFDAEIARIKAEKEEAQSSANAAFGREKMARDEADRLKAELAAAESRLAGIETAALGTREERLKRIDERFKAAKKGGIMSLLNSNELGKLVADLRAEGEVARDAVMGLLDSEDKDERMLGLALLSMGMADPSTYDKIADRALNDPDESIQITASRALMSIEDSSVVKAIKDVLAKTENQGVRVNSMFALLKHGQGVEETMAWIQDDSKPYRRELASGVLILRDPSVKPAIDVIAKGAIERSDKGTLNAAIEYYKDVRSPDCIDALQRLAADSSLSQETRDKAAAALSGN